MKNLLVAALLLSPAPALATAGTGEALPPHRVALKDLPARASLRPRKELQFPAGPYKMALGSSRGLTCSLESTAPRQKGQSMELLQPSRRMNIVLQDVTTDSLGLARYVFTLGGSAHHTITCIDMRLARHLRPTMTALDLENALSPWFRLEMQQPVTLRGCEGSEREIALHEANVEYKESTIRGLGFYDRGHFEGRPIPERFAIQADLRAQVADHKAALAILVPACYGPRMGTVATPASEPASASAR